MKKVLMFIVVVMCFNINVLAGELSYSDIDYRFDFESKQCMETSLEIKNFIIGYLDSGIEAIILDQNFKSESNGNIAVVIVVEQNGDEYLNAFYSLMSDCKITERSYEEL